MPRFNFKFVPAFRAIACLGFLAAAGSFAANPPSPVPAASIVFEGRSAPQPRGRIDELVFGRLRQQGIEPANLCPDAVFIRRVYLDVIGTLPAADEVSRFLQDDRPDKRSALIDRLLERDEFADYWTMKWCDLLRVKAEYPINLWPDAARAYHHWIREAIARNMPYDEFARTLLTSNGSNFRVGPVNFYRAIQGRDPSTIARAVALAFMGARAEKWPADRLAGMAAFFSSVGYKYTSEWKEEIVFFDPDKRPAGAAVFPDGTPARIAPGRDPREVFADWLVRPDNPWFAAVMANRVWCWLFGRGLVDPPDDFRPDNPPSNPELLNFLARELTDSHYDLKHLFRIILNSETYQLSCIPRSDRPEAAAGFAFYVPRRLDAEVLADALNQITGATDEYSSAIPEPYTFIPKNVRAIALPDGSISSPFLEMFGRPARDTGLEAERNDHITAGQRLHLLNSSSVRLKLQQGPKIRALLTARIPPARIVDNLYLTILSRPPTDAERRIIVEYSRASGVPPRQVALDLAWALINSTEFLFRH